MMLPGDGRAPATTGSRPSLASSVPATLGNGARGGPRRTRERQGLVQLEEHRWCQAEVEGSREVTSSRSS